MVIREVRTNSLPRFTALYSSRNFRGRSNRIWLLADAQVLQSDPACFVGHVGNPAPADLRSLSPPYLAFHHGHFSCNVPLRGNRGITVYHDTLLRDPVPF